MYTISFFDVCLSQANKYVIILRSGTETKRTNICQQWTSSPTFDPLAFDDISTLTLQVCEATVDRKLKIIGVFEIKEVELDVSREIKIGQTIEGQFLCVGKCIVKISKVTHGEQHINGIEEEDFEFKEKQDENEDSQVRLHFYCGLRFFLNSTFHVEVKWGAKNGKTRGIKDKINPIWGDSILLKGDIQTEVQIRVKDGKQNILEYAHFSLKPLRILHAYHIRMRFREEYLGDRPEIYFTVVREDEPHFTILQKPIKFKVKSLSTDKSLYAIMSKQGLFPRFNIMDMLSNYRFQNVNDSHSPSVELIPLSETGLQFSVFKSVLTQKLVCAVVSAEARVFEGGTECQTIHVEGDFEKTLRDVYYNERTFSIKQLMEISNPNMHENQKEDNLRSQWKLLSKNYILRTELLNQSIANIAHAKKSIEEKGKELIQLKKILREVKKNGIELKERSQIQVIQQKQRYDVNAWKMREIVDELFAKQEQLTKTRRLNDELRSRMAVLEQVTDNAEQIDTQIVNNSKVIQQQQRKIQTMLAIRKAIPQQREILNKLEGIFEQRHEDKQMNLLLQEQQRKLAEIRQQKKGSLEAVYNLVKEKTKPALKQKIIEAEGTLAQLNKEYALLHR